MILAGLGDRDQSPWRDDPSVAGKILTWLWCEPGLLLLALLAFMSVSVLTFVFAIIAAWDSFS